MLSVAAVRSASGAANYFAKDDYYTVEGSSEATAWAGEGADAIGLSGEVSKEAFEGVLNGILPSGEAVAQVENRRAGVDLTFSMPKSASVMAYVAGDKRVLGANMAAVKATMAWVEKNLAEGRRDVEGRKVPVQTGNLVYALFQHDTSRALDPQAHIHAVIANLTRMPDGKWQALHADKIWSHNSIIGSIYHAYLRSELERIGYQLDMKGKHGTFEIAGVPKAVIAEYSQRREEILDRATQLGIKSPEGLREITKRSRDPKLDVEDRAALKQDYAKARRYNKALCGAIERSMAELNAIEKSMDGSIDAPAAAFAGLMHSAALCAPIESMPIRKAFAALCAALGRWVYIMDAWDDRARDGESGAYNAFNIAAEGANEAELRERAEIMLFNSLREAEEAYMLLRPLEDGAIIENILKEGCGLKTRRLIGGNDDESV